MPLRFGDEIDRVLFDERSAGFVCHAGKDLLVVDKTGDNLYKKSNPEKLACQSLLAGRYSTKLFGLWHLLSLHSIILDEKRTHLQPYVITETSCIRNYHQREDEWREPSSGT